MPFLMTCSYYAMVIFLTAVFIWILFSEDNYAKQISCAILLVPLILRALLIR